ncbi:uncharacterized protein LAESUDRAFT_728082 [Laetiporus sulphureus 93-53]|uniref:Uncharacterized protein n=1 Tax=Laetiporus sulphureus 93-53 TaxID=1314785 RepID=A0A165D7H3_9APHY|nr:uncharacterized protein LAESUDRAFT_728082 [Laetiporus sulphureus 93-53]KZT04279.1 hypothetical protein LAESUDRAFT_728082 [Laetiporus sulphureus 93-53]
MDIGHNKSTSHVQVTPTAMRKGDRHPSRLPSSSPLHLSSRKRSQDDSASDNGRYLSTRVHHELAGRNSSSIPSPAAERKKQGREPVENYASVR